MKKLIQKTDKYIWYQYGSIHRLHVFNDKYTISDNMKGIITKSIENIRKRIEELN
ncbi:hypothetical protein [Clostridium thermobutyricum]|uniref:hypothetical protein n=1 Tax=Clostridium thermobutyricum TaxID=29372 RepID=UPI0018AA7AC6|nr:hypothetical protein [Clostridium thermobutyricum]